MGRLLITPQKPLDETWFARLGPLVAIPSEIYIYLNPSKSDAAEAKEAFYDQHMQYNPVLRPDKRHQKTMEQHIVGLEKLRGEIEDEEDHPIIRRLYLSRIDELLDNCRLWLAASDQDGGSFEYHNQRLYRGPNAKVFAAACQWFRQYATRQLKHQSRGVREAAQEVLDVIPDIPGDTTHIVPDEHTFSALYNWHFRPGGYADKLMHGTFMPEGRAIGQREGDIIIQKVLKNIDIPYKIGDSPDLFWGIYHSNEEFMRPADYRLSPAAFRAIIAHEAGSHLLERANGLRSPLRLLATGLDRYEHGNEGRAYLREQLVMGSVQAALQDSGWYFSLVKHVAISLGVGLYNHPYTFSEVYHVIWALYALQERVQHPDEQLHADERAHRAAWDLTVRILRGTNGQGGAYLKDIVYLEGNVRCWKVAKLSPWLVRYGDMGKFDIANKRHLDDLRALGIVPGGWLIRARRKARVWSRSAKDTLDFRGFGGGKPHGRHR
jgi:hypothetical protein